MRDRRTILLCFGFLLTSCASRPLSVAERERLSRREFAARMDEVHEGMSQEEVLSLLGTPDDVRTPNDAGWPADKRIKEIWCYGTDGHLTFPTLGRVYITTAGQVDLAYGGNESRDWAFIDSEAPSPALIAEVELRDLLRLLDRPPAVAGWHYGPLPVIQIVNRLLPLGKEKALAAIGEYLRITPWFEEPANQGLFVLLRVLFEVPDRPGYLPAARLGIPGPPAPQDPTALPRFPVFLHEDVPFLVVSGYSIGGLPEPVKWHVRYFRERGRLRSRPLVPPKNPFAVLVDLESLPWRTDETFREHQEEVRDMLRNQLLRLVDSVYRVEDDPSGLKFSGEGDADRRWSSIVEEVARLDMRWDEDKNRYVFPDGSYLPDLPVKVYRREIWELGEIEKGFALTLTLERRDSRYVSVTLEQTLEEGSRTPAGQLYLFDPKRREATLGHFSLQERPTRCFETDLEIIEEDPAGTRWRYEVLARAEGEEVQAELRVTGSRRLSSIYRP